MCSCANSEFLPQSVTREWNIAGAAKRGADNFPARKLVVRESLLYLTDLLSTNFEAQRLRGFRRQPLRLIRQKLGRLREYGTAFYFFRLGTRRARSLCYDFRTELR
jgi:hypothetical protein